MKWTCAVSLLGFAFFIGTQALAQNGQNESCGYIYQITETPAGHWTSSNGWYLLPTFNINRHAGVFADFANFYSKGQNVHVQFFGALHAFSNRTRYTPFVFTGIGNIRDSNAGTVTNSLAWFAGAGFLARLTPWVSFQMIPVEYVMNTANWNVGNNFDARIGFALTIPKR